MPVERFRQTLGILALAIHAQRDCGEPAIEHPALIRLQDVAEHHAAAPQHLDVLRVAGQRRACDHVAEPREEFGRGI